MTKDDVLKLPKMKKEGKTNTEIAKYFGVHVRTIDYWIKKLRDKGYDMPTSKRGRPSIL